jgi:NAD(P)-dependent dehydrogenase (short-subunit alcohol dehydrogenase family)
VLMGGACSVRPPLDGAAYAACEGALESSGRALAVDLSPVRVDVVAPGLVVSDLWAKLPTEVKEHNFAKYSADALMHRAGTVSEIAQPVVYQCGRACNGPGHASAWPREGVDLRGRPRNTRRRHIAGPAEPTPTECW